ncbi:hypothetical protein B0H13DRAFT_1864250 [Mycena leptocephala]|nr:hypothetical protein B0H13DRAFT_1864250 [Mycena leptocephala]
MSHVRSDFKTTWSALNFTSGLYELREMPEIERPEYWPHALESALPATLAPHRAADDSLARLKNAPNALHESLLLNLRLGEDGFREQQLILRIQEAIGLQPERTEGDRLIKYSVPCSGVMIERLKICNGSSLRIIHNLPETPRKSDSYRAVYY